MANEIRARFNNVSGTLSGALTNVATSVSSAGLANLGVIDATNYAALSIENEIVWVTAHTGGATTATIVRAQEGTAAAAHSSAVAWSHGPTAFDLGTDWAPYTPTNLNITTGNGTLVGRYTRIGRTIHAYVSFTLGTTSSLTAGGAALGLPTAAAAGSYVGSTWYLDSGVRNWVGSAVTGVDSSTLATLFHTESTSTGNVSSSGPFSFGTGDKIVMTITYEALT